MTIKKDDKVRLLRDNGGPEYGKKGEVGTVVAAGTEYAMVDGIGAGQRRWSVDLAYLELVASSPTSLAQAHDAGLLTAWLGEALGPCVPCGDEALVVRTTWGEQPAMLERGFGINVYSPGCRHAVRHCHEGWTLYGADAFAVRHNRTEAQALAWCARGVRP